MPSDPTIVHSDDAVRHSVERFYLAYIDAISREDMAHYRASFGYPFIILNGDAGTECYLTLEEHAPSYERLFRNLKARGWTRTEVSALGVLAAGTQEALLFSEVVRYRETTPLETLRFCYTVRRARETWKIISALRWANTLPTFCRPVESC